MDYADHSLEEIRARGREFLASYFGIVRGEWLPASRIARSRRQAVIQGAALIRRCPGGPLLNAVFVRPRWRRTGLATALLRQATAALVAAGETVLHSRCVLGNEASLSWHLRSGFRELPDLLVAGHRARIYADELERERRLRGGTGSGIVELEERAERAWVRLRRLDARFRRDPESLMRWME